MNLNPLLHHKQHQQKSPSTISMDFITIGAPTGNRTPNLLIKSQLLCQLSYRRKKRSKLVRVQGIEPWAHGLKGRCSTG
jgi:hypothetical protein